MCCVRLLGVQRLLGVSCIYAVLGVSCTCEITEFHVHVRLLSFMYM